MYKTENVGEKKYIFFIKRNRISFVIQVVGDANSRMIHRMYVESEYSS